ATSRGAGGDVLTLKISERSTITITGRGVKLDPRALAGRRLTTLRLPTRVARATLVVSDRAGNGLIRRLHWRSVTDTGGACSRVPSRRGPAARAWRRLAD